MPDTWRLGDPPRRLVSTEQMLALLDETLKLYRIRYENAKAWKAMSLMATTEEDVINAIKRLGFSGADARRWWRKELKRPARR